MDTGNKYYAVVNGRKPGIYDNWKDCQAQTHKYKGAVFKSFHELCDAEFYLSDNGINQKKNQLVEMTKDETNEEILKLCYKIIQKKLNIQTDDISKIGNDNDQQSGFTSINHELEDLNIQTINNKGSQAQDLQTFLQNNK